MNEKRKNLTEPKSCYYTNSFCDQSFEDLQESEAFFIYPSEPLILATTIYETVKQLQLYGAKKNWVSWEKLSVSGQIIFCEICKAIRTSKLIIANITTANFNVFFELGYAIGLKKPVLPVRDISYVEQKQIIDEIGIFDTIGYETFTNSKELVSKITSKKSFSPTIYTAIDIKQRQPIFYIKSHIDTDGSLKLTSRLKKSYFRFRSFDPKETSRLSLHEAYNQVMSSVTVIAHLMDDNRGGATVHNARAAFICGMALAAGKHVLMLQEGSNYRPIDYRDIIIQYNNADAIPGIMEDVLRKTADSIQQIQFNQDILPKGLLERIDLGDVAAENEISTLTNYFVKTPQFQQTRQGHARIVVGRKGAGKSALFYGVRNQLLPQRNILTVDLKPEGHQFTKLREKVLENLTDGMKLHVLTTFWYYLLLLEITNKVIEMERNTAFQSATSIKRFEEIQKLYEEHTSSEGDFSERLMNLVNRIINKIPTETKLEIQNSDITNAIYNKEIKGLVKILNEHIKDFFQIWILFDNIDKGFPTHGVEKEDILILRCLLEASRKIQNTFQNNKLNCITTVFIRRDVYDLLIDETPDRGKEQFVNLDWSDIELLKELLLKRFIYQAPELSGNFEDVWANLFELHVFGENSFQYIINRTFLRPRDVLNFVRKCIQIAISRNHDRVSTEDIQIAEQQFSEDMRNELRYEIRDIFSSEKDMLLAFMSANKYLTKEDIQLILFDVGIQEENIERFIDILLWFSFLGVKKGEDEYYSYNFLYNLEKQKLLIKNEGPTSVCFCIHPAFRMSLKV